MGREVYRWDNNDDEKNTTTNHNHHDYQEGYDSELLLQMTIASNGEMTVLIDVSYYHKLTNSIFIIITITNTLA